MDAVRDAIASIFVSSSKIQSIVLQLQRLQPIVEFPADQEAIISMIGARAEDTMKDCDTLIKRVGNK